jgi:hypothetical protein
MPPERRDYDLEGQRLAVVGSAGAPVSFLDPILAPRSTLRSEGHWQIDLDIKPTLPPPPESEPRWEGILPEGLTARLGEAHEWEVLQAPDNYRIELHAARRIARIIVVPGSAAWLSATPAFWLLGRILESADRHLLHAAALLRPARGDAVLLFAPSGTGKTTTGLALARNGYRLLGDDAAVVDPPAAGPLVCWSLPRAVRLHRQTVALLPWLRAYLSTDKCWKAAGGADEEDSVVLPLSTLGGNLAMLCSGRFRCGGIIALEAPNPVAHRVAPLGTSDALLRIMLDNVRLPPQGLDARGERRIDALAGLVRAVPAITLSAGPDPASLSTALLEAAWAETETVARRPV